MPPPALPDCRRRRRAWGVCVLAALLCPAAPAQVKPEKPDKSEMRELKREMGADALGKPKRTDKNEAKGGRPAGEAEARTAARLREYLEITDDAEWEIVVARIREVVEARAALGIGVPGLRGAPPPAENDRRSPRPGGSGRPEQDALRSALRDRLPDEEIKARLARAHETFVRSQARVEKAHDELRAVLTVRQEAVAVLAGLLPP